MSDQQTHVCEIFSVAVKLNSTAAYEGWLKKVEVALTQQKGFAGIEVIRPANRAAQEYLILLRFATLPDLEAGRVPQSWRTWRSSDYRRASALRLGGREAMVLVRDRKRQLSERSGGDGRSDEEIDVVGRGSTAGDPPHPLQNGERRLRCKGDANDDTRGPGTADSDWCRAWSACRSTRTGPGTTTGSR